jgi:hypothetical protein
MTIEEEKQEEHLIAADLLVYKQVVTNSMLASSAADKAIAENKAAQMEAKYIVLSLFMKYHLVPGKDDIRDDGKILRAAIEKQTEQPEQPQPAEIKELENGQ